MSKSKKLEKEKKDLSIPPLPDPIFVVELDEHVLLTGYTLTDCVFPYYRFDNDCDSAFSAAEDMASQKKKLVVDAVNFHLYYPHIYDPIKLDADMQRLMETIKNIRIDFNRK